jgi:hypothetical protein
VVFGVDSFDMSAIKIKLNPKFRVDKIGTQKESTTFLRYSDVDETGAKPQFAKQSTCTGQ